MREELGGNDILRNELLQDVIRTYLRSALDQTSLVSTSLREHACERRIACNAIRLVPERLV